MEKGMDILAFLEEAKTIPVADVRTPSEYNQGHIPGAYNLPLFSDEERKKVGTTYKLMGQEEAIFMGLEFAGPRMKSLAKEASRIATHKKLLIHCWRGGMRSAGMAWLFRTSGIQCYTLDKGYKSFRRHVLEFLEGDFPFVVLGGLTGSGKTDLLHELEEQGQQILDLEKLASHKGSAFGGIGKGPQPTNEQFENDLFWALNSMNRDYHVWTEDESRTIGRNTLPGGIYRNIRKAPLIFLDVPLEKRLDRLVSDYACFPAGELIRAIEKIRPRLGGKSATLAIEGVREKNYRQTAAIVLKYYDKTYLYGLAKRDKSRVLEFKESKQAEASGLASGLLQFAREKLPKEPRL